MRLRARARRQGREATEDLRKLDPAAFDRLHAMNASILRLYHGLEDGLNWTKVELADRFGLSVWRISEILRQSRSMLLDPSAEPPVSPEVVRRRRAERIAEARRQRGRPAAEALRALPPSAFGALPELERDLVRRYYGVDGKPSTSRELGRLHGLQPDRVERLVSTSVRTLLGTSAVAAIGRTCGVCGNSFTVNSRAQRRLACGPVCERTLRQRTGIASAAARRGGRAEVTT